MKSFSTKLDRKEEEKRKPNPPVTFHRNIEKNIRRMGTAITKIPKRGTSIVKKPQVIKQWSKVVFKEQHECYVKCDS